MDVPDPFAAPIELPLPLAASLQVVLALAVPVVFGRSRPRLAAAAALAVLAVGLPLLARATGPPALRVVLMGFGSLLTGLAIYKPVQFSWLTWLFGGYPMARFFHFWLTVGYVLFFVVHIAQVIRAGWNNFRSMIIGNELIDVPDPVEVSHD